MKYRDMKRILSKLQTINAYNPELRLGQLLVNSLSIKDDPSTLFYLSDEAFESRLDSIIDKLDDTSE